MKAVPSCLNNSSANDIKAEETSPGENKWASSTSLMEMSCKKAVADEVQGKNVATAENDLAPGKLEAEKNWLRRRLERDRMKAILNHSGNNRHHNRFAGKNSSLLVKKRREEERRRRLAEKLIRREERIKTRNEVSILEIFSFPNF